MEHCGSDRSASVSNLPSGSSLHCFRCGASHFEPHGPRSIAEILASRRALDRITSAKEMPPDAVPLPDGPTEAWQWVLLAGLSPELAYFRYGMRWHEESRRVLIPIPGGVLGRAIFGERPKYRMMSNEQSPLYWPQERRGAAVVVVEDILSAIAVDRAGWPAVAILGTSIDPVQAAQIAAGRERVFGWFDGDSAGDAAFVKLRNRMGLHDVQVIRIRTHQDPKLLHLAEIRAILEKEA